MELLEQKSARDDHRGRDTSTHPDQGQCCEQTEWIGQALLSTAGQEAWRGGRMLQELVQYSHVDAVLRRWWQELKKKKKKKELIKLLDFFQKDSTSTFRQIYPFVNIIIIVSSGSFIIV